MSAAISAAEQAALDRAYAATAARMLAQVKAISNAPNSQMQRSLKLLDEEAARLADNDERMTATNPQFEQTMNEYEATFNTTQSLILANDNIIQDAAKKIAIPVVTAKVFLRSSALLVARKINPISAQAMKYYTTQTAAAGIPWTVPPLSALDAVGDYVASPAWINRMDKWGSGYAGLTRDTFVKGISQGWGPQFTASQVRLSAQSLPVSAAENLTRTLQITSYRDASTAMEVVNSDYIVGKIRISALTENTCLACISLHGTKLAVGERVDDHFRGRCSEFYQVPGGPEFPATMQADSVPGGRNFVKFQNGDDWFASLPPERQAQQASFLRSPAKRRAYDAGTPLSSFVGDHTDDVFGAQIIEQSLMQSIGTEQASGFYSVNQ